MPSSGVVARHREQHDTRHGNRVTRVARFLAAKYGRLLSIRDVRQSVTESVTQTIDIAVARRTNKSVTYLRLLLYYALTRSLQLSTFCNTVVCIFIIMQQQELSYRQQIARQLRTRYAESIWHKYYTVTLKSRLRVTQGHWKRKLGCCFLFAFYSNYGRICRRLLDIQCQRMSEFREDV